MFGNKGDVYGKLKVLEVLDTVEDTAGVADRLVFCRCECGDVGVYRLQSLLSGVRSCGSCAEEIAGFAVKKGDAGPTCSVEWFGYPPTE